MKIRTGFVSNSSSSSFVCDIKMPFKEVKEKLNLMLELHNKLFGTTLTFEQTFKEPKIGTKKDDEFYKDWDYLERIYPDNTSVGKLIINSRGDNTVPYELFELIESAFKGQRLHLG